MKNFKVNVLNEFNESRITDDWCRKIMKEFDEKGHNEWLEFDESLVPKNWIKKVKGVFLNQGQEKVKLELQRLFSRKRFSIEVIVSRGKRNFTMCNPVVVEKNEKVFVCIFFIKIPYSQLHSSEEYFVCCLPIKYFEEYLSITKLNGFASKISILSVSEYLPYYLLPKSQS
jgi:hypothetical protein